MIKKTKSNSDITDFVVNPVTGKLIKIGSRNYNQLLKDNILNLDPSTRKKTVVFDGDGDDEFKKKLKVGENLNLVRRNGKIVENRRKITTMENIQHITKKSAEIVKEHINDFTDDMDDEQIYKKVKQLLSQKIIGDVEPPKKKFELLEPLDNGVVYNLSDSDSDEHSP
jgi:hypothetical protein